MLTLDPKTHQLLCRTTAGRMLWRGDMRLEDSEATHAFDGTRCGPWPVTVTLGRRGGLDLLTLRIEPVAGRTLRRCTVRVASGREAVPALDSPDTKVLVFAKATFAPDGVVAAGPGVQLESTLAMLVQAPRRGLALLFGLGAPAADFSAFRCDADGLTAGFDVNRELLRAETYPLAFAHGPDPLTLLDAFGDHLARFARPATGPQTGWNSWDYYAGAVSMTDVRREMAAINDSPLRGKVRHIVLDMGWEQSWGEWTPNRRFPGRFRTIAREIEAAGFVPGIWVAPLQCHMFSPLGRHRQDLLVPRENGTPVTEGQHAIFDFTLPEVQAILADGFGDMRAAGFRLFKLDYVYKSYLDVMDRCADRTLGKAAVIRRGFEAIRAAVGHDSHVMNCGGPVEATLGIADSARVTVDIHTFWGHVRFNAKQLSARLWQNGRLWTVDPDFAVIRCADTTTDRFLNFMHNRRPLVDGQSHWMAGPDATFGELRTWLTQVYLTAGNTFLSDSVARLNTQGIDALGSLFPPLPESARPLDLFHSPMPRFWLAPRGRRPLLGVFNWEDTPLPATIPRGLDVPTSGTDRWTGERVRLGEATVMPPRSAWLLDA